MMRTFTQNLARPPRDTMTAGFTKDMPFLAQKARKDKVPCVNLMVGYILATGKITSATDKDNKLFRMAAGTMATGVTTRWMAMANTIMPMVKSTKAISKAENGTGKEPSTTPTVTSRTQVILRTELNNSKDMSV